MAIYAKAPGFVESINVDQNTSYPPAAEELKKEGVLSVAAQLRCCKYLTNIVEQDHRRGQVRFVADLFNVAA